MTRDNGAPRQPHLSIRSGAQALLLSPDPIVQSITNLPPVIALGGQPTPGSFLLAVIGLAGQVITLQVSEDLATWIDVQTFTLSGGREVLQATFPAPPPPSAFFRLQWNR